MHFEFIYAVVPLFAYYVCGCSPEQEIMLTRVCTMAAFIQFVTVIVRLAVQYVREEKVYFFTIKDKQQ